MRRADARQSLPQAGALLRDLRVSGLLGLLGAAVSLAAAQHFPAILFTDAAENVWFSADQRRYFTNVLVPWAEGHHERTSVHPAFSILFYPAVAALAALGLPGDAAAQSVIAASAGGTVALFHRGLRHLGLDAAAAAAFALVLIASAGFLFWGGVVETYIVGMLSIAFAFWVLCGPARPLVLWVLGSAATLAITTTNWSFGLAAAFFRCGLWGALRISASALLLVLALALAQKVLFPSAVFFFDVRQLLTERHYAQFSISDPEAKVWTPIANLRVIMMHGVVTPAPQVKHVRELREADVMVTNQGARLVDHRPFGAAAAGIWAGLLGLGVWGLFRMPRRDVALTLAAFSLGQIALHLVYGSVTFLYAGNFLLPLVAIAAMAVFTPARTVVTPLALALALLAALNNWPIFVDAAAEAVAIATRQAGG